MNEPSPNELARYLDQMRQSFDRLTARLEKFEEKADRAFVTRELHTLALASEAAARVEGDRANEKATVELSKDLDEVKVARSKDADNRRTVMLALAVVALTSLTSLILWLLSLAQGAPT